MANQPLNILLITSDQQHWDTIGAFNPDVKTPALDSLVAEGTTFTRSYCPNPTCTPSRASIITGLYPSQHGAYSLGTKLDEKVNTLGDELIKGGYKTALIGKAHLQPLLSTEEYPSVEAPPILQDLEFWKNYKEKFYGFEHVELARNHTNENLVGQHYAIWMEEKGCANWKDYFLVPTGNMTNEDYPRMEAMAKSKPRGFIDGKRTWGTWDLPEEFHYNTWIAERSNVLLEKYAKNKEPFFLWSSFFDPHPEYFVSKPWDTMYDPDKITLPKRVEGEHEKNPPHFKMTQEEFPDYSSYVVKYGPHGFHSHLQKDEELKKDIAVYYGMVSFMDKYIGKILDKLEEVGLKDNTLVVFTSDHGHYLGQHGLIRKGPFHYEDGIKVPMIVRYPNHIPQNKVSEALQSLVDYTPTFLSFADLPVPEAMTGVDQKDVWLGTKDKIREDIICENAHEHPTVNLRTYVDERYKITVYYGHEYGELFDLQEDPNEFNNLWDSTEHQQLKIKLLLKYCSAELEKESRPMPRIKHA